MTNLALSFYYVLPLIDVLENFKNENGQFFCSSTVEEKEVRCMLTLFRASEMSFPGEKVMDEAKAFTTEYLTKVLTGVDVTDVDQSLLREVSSNDLQTF
jgi:hypothetical protein